MHAVCYKVQWPTQAKANENLMHGHRTGQYESGHKVYYCTNCHSYHIGRRRYPKKHYGKKT